MPHIIMIELIFILCSSNYIAKILEWVLELPAPDSFEKWNIQKIVFA